MGVDPPGRHLARPVDPHPHNVSGARIIAAAPASQTMTGTVSEWEKWTGMAFPETGDYVTSHRVSACSMSTRPAITASTWSPTCGCSTCDGQSRVAGSWLADVDLLSGQVAVRLGRSIRWPFSKKAPAETKGTRWAPVIARHRA
ncbi:hypothetical protein GCM10017687_12150 [Streptomyces echinatus]